MNIYCPRCKKKLELPDGFMGQQAKCLHCGKIFLVDRLAKDDAAFIDALVSVIGEKATQRVIENVDNERMAEHGDAQAQYEVGLFYYEGYESNGNNFLKNFTKAAKWLKLAANNGHADAQNLLGHMYLKGEGVSRDLIVAVKCFRMAAELGHAEAQCALGECFWAGKGTQINYAEAYEWFLKAANQGFAKAQRMVALFLFGGMGVKEDKVEAVKWYKKAAEQGEVRAQLELANRYFNGEGVEQNQD